MIKITKMKIFPLPLRCGREAKPQPVRVLAFGD
jgi:hypothetical protein